MQTEKECIICGKLFIPYRQNNKCCSKQCSKVNKDNYTKEYIHTSAFKERNKVQNRKRLKQIFCTVCGKEIEKEETSNGRISRKTMHDSCVIYDCIQTLRSGKALSEKQYERLRARGYDMHDIREEAFSTQMEGGCVDM